MKKEKRDIFEIAAQRIIDSFVGRAAEKIFMQNNSAQRKAISELYPRNDAGEIHRKGRIARLACVLKLVAVFGVLSLLCGIFCKGELTS